MDSPTAMPLTAVPDPFWSSFQTLAINRCKSSLYFKQGPTFESQIHQIQENFNPSNGHYRLAARTPPGSVTIFQITSSTIKQTLKLDHQPSVCFVSKSLHLDYRTSMSCDGIAQETMQALHHQGPNLQVLFLDVGSGVNFGRHFDNGIMMNGDIIEVNIPLLAAIGQDFNIDPDIFLRLFGEYHSLETLPSERNVLHMYINPGVRFAAQVCSNRLDPSQKLGKNS